jgi:hypothetical protein
VFPDQKEAKYLKQYYLLSLPNNTGYTYDINKAGVYTEEQINASKDYYCDKSTMPVPVELIEKAQTQKVVVNDSFNYKLFGIAEHWKVAKEY